MSEIQKSYYAIIPANVRYDKGLSSSAKLLYGEITALCNEKGYCWASNSYFSGLYNVSTVTISRWIKRLSESGHIENVVIRNEKKEVVERQMYITNPDPINKNVNRSKQKGIEGLNKNVNTPINKNVKDNNTVINNTSNKKDSSLKLINSEDNKKKSKEPTKDTELFNSLKDYLLTKYKHYHNTEYSDFPKELRHIKIIIKKSKGDKVIIFNKLQIFEEKFKNPTSSYWSEMAFLPSKISGMWDSLNPPRKIVKNAAVDEDPLSEYEDFTPYKSKEA